MRLKDLLEQIDFDSEVIIQISYSYEEFSKYFDAFRGDSPVLWSLADREIDCLTAIDKNVFRLVLIPENGKEKANE